MSNIISIPFIVKVSVLGYFSLGIFLLLSISIIYDRLSYSISYNYSLTNKYPQIYSI